MRRTYHFVQEPRGELLRSLIGALAQCSASVTLVVRDDLGLSERGQAILRRLRTHLRKQERRSSWPGTILLYEEATVFEYDLEPEVLDELVAAAGGLFDWHQPELPEDLALLRSDGTAVLASVSHEHDAYLQLTELEYSQLVAAIPELIGVVS